MYYTFISVYNIEVLCWVFSQQLCENIWARNVPKEHNPYLYNCVYGKIGFNVVSVKVVAFRNLTTMLMGESVYIMLSTTK